MRLNKIKQDYSRWDKRGVKRAGVTFGMYIVIIGHAYWEFQGCKQAYTPGIQKGWRKLSWFFEKFYFNSTKNLFWTYYQNNLTKSIGNQRVIKCSILRIWHKMVRNFRNWYIQLSDIELTNAQRSQIIWTICT